MILPEWSYRTLFPTGCLPRASRAKQARPRSTVHANQGFCRRSFSHDGYGTHALSLLYHTQFHLSMITTPLMPHCQATSQSCNRRFAFQLVFSDSIRLKRAACATGAPVFGHFPLRLCALASRILEPFHLVFTLCKRFPTVFGAAARRPPRFIPAVRQHLSHKRLGIPRRLAHESSGFIRLAFRRPQSECHFAWQPDTQRPILRPGSRGQAATAGTFG